MANTEQAAVVSDKQSSKSPVSYRVVLNVYDVTNASSLKTNSRIIRINSMTRDMGLGGVFHGAIELFGPSIRGLEWSFGYCIEGTGVYKCAARSNTMYTFRETVDLGFSNATYREVMTILAELKRDWTGNTYELLSRNCCHFCEDFCKALGAKPPPAWLNRFAQSADATIKFTNDAHLMARRVTSQFSAAAASGCSWFRGSLVRRPTSANQPGNPPVDSYDPNSRFNVSSGGGSSSSSEGDDPFDFNFLSDATPERAGGAAAERTATASTTVSAHGGVSTCPSSARSIAACVSARASPLPSPAGATAKQSPSWTTMSDRNESVGAGSGGVVAAGMKKQDDGRDGSGSGSGGPGKERQGGVAFSLSSLLRRTDNKGPVEALRVPFSLNMEVEDEDEAEPMAAQVSGDCTGGDRPVATEDSLDRVSQPFPFLLDFEFTSSFAGVKPPASCAPAAPAPAYGSGADLLSFHSPGPNSGSLPSNNPLGYAPADEPLLDLDCSLPVCEGKVSSARFAGWGNEFLDPSSDLDLSLRSLDGGRESASLARSVNSAGAPRRESSVGIQGGAGGLLGWVSRDVVTPAARGWGAGVSSSSIHDQLRRGSTFTAAPSKSLPGGRG